MSRLFITGGAGLVGSHIVREYLNNGWEVTALVRNPESAVKRLQNPKVHLIKGDILRPETYASAMKGHDLLIHSAAFHSSWAPGHDKLMFKTNVNATISILRSAEEAGLRNVIYTSSTKSIGFDPSLKAQNETVEYNLEHIDGVYGRSKAAAEKAVMEYGGKLRIKILNPTAVLGTMDTQPTPTGLMILRAIREKIHFYLDMPLSFVDVSDVARAHYLASKTGNCKERYILAASPITMRQFLQHIDHLIGYERRYIKVPFPLLNPMAQIFYMLTKLSHFHPPFTKSGAKMVKYKMVYDGKKAENTFDFSYQNVFASLSKAVSWFMGYCPG